MMRPSIGVLKLVSTYSQGTQMAAATTKSWMTCMHTSKGFCTWKVIISKQNDGRK